MRLRVIFAVFLWVMLMSAGRVAGQQASQTLVQDIELRFDTNSFSYQAHKVIIKNEDFFAFEVKEESNEFEVYLSPSSLADPESIEILGSNDITVIDSLIMMTPQLLRGKISIKDLRRPRFISLLIQGENRQGKALVQEIKLMPYVVPMVQLMIRDEEVFSGEQKVFEFNGSHLHQVNADNIWHNEEKYEYRLAREDNRLRLYLIPKVPGKFDFKLELFSRFPYMNKDKQVTTAISTFKHSFYAKTGRQAYLAIDNKDITLGEDIGKGIEVYIDNHRNLQIKKTYRIENQAEAGGALIGEIFTQSALNNGRVLCYFRPFALHRVTSGYLYIKDGDDLKFITNLNITPKTTIERVLLMSESQDYLSDLSVHPGAEVTLRIEGKSINKARYAIEEIEFARRDSMQSDETYQVIKFRVPLNISKRRLNLLANGKSTGFAITIREFQEPRKFDFITLKYADKSYQLDKSDNQLLYEKTLKDVVLSFSNEKIDDKSKLYGKQYISIAVNIYNNRQQLLEARVIDNLVICPGDNSPRAGYYNIKDCNNNDVSINSLLSRKTYALDDWNSIELIIKHNQGQYGAQGYVKKVLIILKRKYNFDLDVSFPGGLLIKRVGDSKIDPFGGVSLAAIGQFRFFKPDKIEQLQPYRIGVGFLALNAFNFNSGNVNRDLGVVILGSLLPINTGSKLSFPLHAGFGYLTSANKFFYVLGPGIGIRF